MKLSIENKKKTANKLLAINSKKLKKKKTKPNLYSVHTESSVVSMITPFGRSPTKGVSLKLILALLAAVDVAAPRCGFVASSKTFKEAIACNCVAFSSTLPAASATKIQNITLTYLIK